MFQRLDSNKDGFIDVAEVDELAKRRFDRIDTNDDGGVSADEWDARQKGTAKK